MAPMLPRHIKEPPIFGQETNNFCYWKKIMIYFFKANEVWDIVKNEYVPKFDENNELTTESKLESKDNLYVINYIINSVSGLIFSLIKDVDSAHEIWEDLINRYEVNTQTKRSETKTDGQDLNLTLVTNGIERLMMVDVDSIVISKNITNKKTIEVPTKIVTTKNKKMDSNDSSEASTSSANEVTLELENNNHESKIELINRCVEIDDTSSSLDKDQTHRNEIKLRFLLDKSYKILLRKE